MSVSCKLYQKKSRAKPDGTAPVYLVLRIGGTERLTHTGRHLHTDHFDNASGRVRRGAADSMRLNAYFQSLLRGMEKAVLDLQSAGRAVTHAAVAAALGSGGGEGLVPFARREMEADRGRLSPKYYGTVMPQLRKLEAYSPGLTFGQVTFDFLRSYESHLRGLGNKPNTIRGDMVMIRKFMNLAIKKGLATSHPFADYRMPGESVQKEWLTLKEMEALHGLYDGGSLTARLSGTLGHFLLSCYTGLRFGDVGRLRADDIRDGRISVRTQKRGKTVDIPLSGRALRLLGEYENGRVFASALKQSNSRVNTDLAELMGLAGVSKHITFHCSRHSFAINSLVLGIPLEVISSVLGHSDLKTTQIYARIVDELKAAQMDKWNY